MGAIPYFFMKKIFKWSIAGVLWACVGACVIGLAVGCTSKFNNTTITVNNNGISIHTAEPLTKFNIGTQSIPLSTSSSNLEGTTITNNNNTLNFPSQITYKANKSFPCIISLLTENGTFNAITSVKWNNATKSWDVYSEKGVVWSQVNEAGTTSFLFNLSLIAPTNTFTTNSYYFRVTLKNL